MQRWFRHVQQMNGERMAKREYDSGLEAWGDLLEFGWMEVGPWSRRERLCMIDRSGEVSRMEHEKVVV